MNSNTHSRADWAAAIPLPPIADDAFAQSFDCLGEAKLVVLGDGSHGTQEFYSARAAISRYLIEKHGFTVVAIEAENCDVMHLDRAIRGRAMAESEQAFDNPAPWLWRNQEFDRFVRWMREWNQQCEPEQQTAIYGLDMQKAKTAMEAVSVYLHSIRSPAADAAEQYGALVDNFRDNPFGHIAAQKEKQHKVTAETAVSIRNSVKSVEPSKNAPDRAAWFEAMLNSIAAVHAVNFDEACQGAFTDRWNAREAHITDALNAILDETGPEAKVLVWAHNSHAGNAAFSEMSWKNNQYSLGQMIKQRLALESLLVGFGTHHGTVRAARKWGLPSEVLPISEPLADSWESVSHAVGLESFLLDLRNLRTTNSVVMPYRTFGTYYAPEQEREHCYLEADLIRQFDYWVWFDETSALIPR